MYAVVRVMYVVIINTLAIVTHVVILGSEGRVKHQVTFPYSKLKTCTEVVNIECRIQSKHLIVVQFRKGVGQSQRTYEYS